MGDKVVVIGAGSAGSVLARRLVDAGHRVVLLEAGAEDLNPAIHSVHRLGELWRSADDWDYFTTPQAQANNRRLHLPRGRVLGGSHALNATIWVRGTQADHDGWAAAGATGWSWSDVEPYYRKIENFHGRSVEGGNPRGTDGLLHVTSDYELAPVAQSIWDAAVAYGIPENPDYNAGRLDGIGVEQVNIHQSKRQSTWVAYAKPLIGHERFEVRTGAHTLRVLVDGGSATGVEYLWRNEIRREEADRVILCAGALDSPQLLMRSGIGPADHLRSVGIDVVHDLPGVGANLHDHLLVPVICETTTRLIEPPVDGASISQTHHFSRSSADLAEPDTQPIHFTVGMYQDGMTGPASAFSLEAGIIRPASRGRLLMSGPNVTDRALIDLNVFDAPEDLDAMLFSLRECREIARQAPLVEGWGAREIYPGAGVRTEEEEREYIRNTVVTYHHQVGTCRMGTDADAVVSPVDLGVHGVSGLHVVDASIMPRVTTGNTNAPAVMIGERGADLLLSDPVT